MQQGSTLKSKTISGMIWSFIDTIGKQITQLLIQIILARLLLPEDFGMIGIVIVLINLFEIFIESGFKNGLIRDLDTKQSDLKCTL